MIRSFDVFDTLLARRFINSEPVWRMMERKTGIPGFMAKRQAADTGNRNLTQIYHNMVDNVFIHADTVPSLVAMEVQAEMEFAFPIRENLSKVQDGDLLISDMYMEPYHIMDLVRSVGLDKQVTIYQSNDGKRSGHFWADMAYKLPLAYHLGDNHHSDVLQAEAHGFQAKHYTGTNHMTTVEQSLIKDGLQYLGCLVREVRLRNYEPTHSNFLDVATQLNLPWLFICCELLARLDGQLTPVFLGRDCELMSRIWNAYYGLATYLPFSRQLALSQPEEAVSYLKSQTPPKALLVDISSTGRTWEVLATVDPLIKTHVMIYSDLYQYQPVKQLPAGFTYTTKNSVMGQTNEVLEVFNCGSHGKVVGVELINGVPLLKFASHELPPAIVRIVHQPVKDAVMLRPYYHGGLRAELHQASTDTLMRYFNMLAMAVCRQTAIQAELGGHLGYLEADRRYTASVGT